MKKNFQYKFYGLILYFILKLISLTTKIKLLDLREDKTFSPKIYSFWHSKLIAPAILFNSLIKLDKKVALSSPSKDGELISVPLEKMGYTLVRGSSDKNSIASTISLLKFLKKDYSIGTPVDGPKGPKEIVKPGLIFLAQKSKIKIVPIGVYYEKKWILKKTWDKFEIPKLFSKISIVLGKEFDINFENDIEKISLSLGEEINKMNKKAEEEIINE